MDGTKPHIKYMYPQVAAALEEVIFADKKKYAAAIRLYRGYQRTNGSRMRITLDNAISILTENGYEVEVNVVTKADVKNKKANPSSKDD